ncbi:O-antigen ligase family protein [Natronococcus pandeyae]|nr:hypothetical protein [Natronococcus pandeyae]
MTTYLPYVFLTPLSIVALVLVAPQLIRYDPLRYAISLSTLVVAFAVIGYLLLLSHHYLGVDASWTGRDSIGGYPVLITSVFENPNHFGIVTTIGTVSVIYAWLETRRTLWAVAIPVLVVAILFSYSRTALAAGAVGTIVLLFKEDRRIGIVVGTAAIVGLLAIVYHPFFEEYYRLADESFAGRMDVWEEAWLAATVDPFVGAAFDSGIRHHNSYVSVLLNAGFVAGGFYLLAVGGALALAARKSIRGDRWDAYVFATLLVICIQFLTESTTFGGLTTMSLLFGLYAGLIVQLPTGRLRRYERFESP